MQTKIQLSIQRIFTNVIAFIFRHFSMEKMLCYLRMDYLLRKVIYSSKSRRQIWLCPSPKLYSKLLFSQTIRKYVNCLLLQRPKWTVQQRDLEYWQLLFPNCCGSRSNLIRFRLTTKHVPVTLSWCRRSINRRSLTDQMLFSMVN